MEGPLDIQREVPQRFSLRSSFTSMEVRVWYLRVLTLAISLVILVSAPFSRVNARVETFEQAQADQKLLAQVEEMQKEADKPGANDQQTVLRLRSFKVGNIQWLNIGVPAALADLKVKSKAADPDHVGFDFVLRLPSNIKQKDCLGRTVNNNICISLKETTSVFDLLNYMSEQTNLSFEVQKGIITMKFWEPGAYFFYGLLMSPQ